MNYINEIKKNKKRKFLIISASGQNKGIQIQLIEISPSDWHVISQCVIEYNSPLNDLINNIENNKNRISISKIAKLDLLYSRFLKNLIIDFIHDLPITKRRIDLIVLNSLVIWSGEIDSDTLSDKWNISMGDPDYITQKCSIPVVTDFIKQSIIDGRENTLPTLNGDMKISKKISGPAVFVNIGLNSQITAVAAAGYPLLFVDEISPSIKLIDLVAEKVGLDYGFDRDGSEALKGFVNTTLLEEFNKLLLDLTGDDAILKFKQILSRNKIKFMKNNDLLATVTAFTALKIVNLFKKHYSISDRPDTIWISGGGINNQAIVKHLTNYFNPIEIKTVDNLGIDGNNRIPLSLALSVNSYIDNEDIIMPPGIRESVTDIGRWFFPRK